MKLNIYIYKNDYPLISGVSLPTNHSSQKTTKYISIGVSRVNFKFRINVPVSDEHLKDQV